MRTDIAVFCLQETQRFYVYSRMREKIVRFGLTTNMPVEPPQNQPVEPPQNQQASIIKRHPANIPQQAS